MGTLRDWIEVAALGILWGGAMLLWTTRKRTDGGTQWPRSIHQIMCCAFTGLLFGILVNFEWTAFHRPLIFVTLPAFALTLVFRFTAISYARKNRRSN